MMYMTNLSDLLFSNKELTSGMIVGYKIRNNYIRSFCVFSSTVIFIIR